MKSKFLLLLLTFFTLTTIAKTELVTKVNEEGVFEAEKTAIYKNKSKKELYNEVLKWISNDTNTSENIIQYQVMNKKISVRSISKNPIKGIKKTHESFSYYVDINIKDEKIRFKLSNIRFTKNNATKTSVCMESSLIKKNGTFKKGNKYIQFKMRVDQAVSKIFSNLHNSIIIDSKESWD